MTLIDIQMPQGQVSDINITMGNSDADSRCTKRIPRNITPPLIEAARIEEI